MVWIAVSIFFIHAIMMPCNQLICGLIQWNEDEHIKWINRWQELKLPTKRSAYKKWDEDGNTPQYILKCCEFVRDCLLARITFWEWQRQSGIERKKTTATAKKKLTMSHTKPYENGFGFVIFFLFIWFAFMKMFIFTW